MSNQEVQNASDKRLKAVVVSDLHMFSRRSEIKSHLDAIHRAAEDADLFILNGDTFDFKWTVLPSVLQTVEAAVLWLQELCEQHRDTQFHFILGNHDNLQLFIDELSQLSLQTENLAWHPYYLRIGDVAFLHGDVSDRLMDAAGLEKRRELWLHDTKVRHRMLHNVYDAVMLSGAHLVIQRILYPKKRVARRIVNYLEDVGLGRVDGIKHVYFGHTHDAMRDFEHEGMVFHNPGTPMRGMSFQILEVEVHPAPDEDRIR